MTIPAILMGVVVSTLIGAAFHFWKGGGFWRLMLYLIISWIGFWAGHFAGEALSWTFGSIGPLNMGMALVCCVALLGVGYWLSLVKVEKPA